MENNGEAKSEDDMEDNSEAREIVAPGEVLSTDVDTYKRGRGTILNKDGSKIISVLVGLKQVRNNYINVIPLSGFYTARTGDKVIAIVVDKNPVKYRCDINAKYEAILRPQNAVKHKKRKRRDKLDTEKFDIGDLLVAKIISADRLNSPELTLVGKYLGRKKDGICLTIDPPKVPRVIGRNGSMIKMLKGETNCNIFVTQNGRIWLKGDNFEYERLAIEAIYKIEKEAHTRGLTDRIGEFLKQEKEKRGIS
jgi:exosome complex component RRP4